MNIIDIITKKRNKEVLTKEELEYVINGYLNNTIKDYQVSSLLMAIVIQGMDMDEIYNLTDIMLNSGDIIDLSIIDGVKVDKHSTGGIGDKTTMILAPIVASIGIPVAKMSGRGLGYTGGTIDKLESIPGIKVSLTHKEFIKQVNSIGCAIIGQTGNLVPADKALYALRDVSGTVASLPLIASSIMSKKLASGADKILIDVKVGLGALVSTIDEAKKLASIMVKIGKKYNKETICVITNMNEPLGCNVGNALEVLECIDILKNKGSDDLRELVIYLATYMVHMGLEISLDASKTKVLEVLSNNLAYKKFTEMVEMQGGDLNKISLAPKVFSIKSTKTGFINSINALKVGKIVHQIGAGRINKDDMINYGVGLILTHKTHDFITEGEELAKVYLDKIDLKMQDVLDCFDIVDSVDSASILVYDVVS